MSFTLDTSGSVQGVDFKGGIHMDPAEQHWPEIYWSDLDPFTQGYVEGLAGWCRDNCVAHSLRNFGFSDLAPETVAAILKDCAEMVAPERFTFENSVSAGRFCWEARQAGWFVMSGRAGLRDRFPPQTPYIGDDGKVYLRAQAGRAER